VQTKRYNKGRNWVVLGVKSQIRNIKTNKKLGCECEHKGIFEGNCGC